MLAKKSISDEDRSRHEIEHAHHLLEAGAEAAWGWGTPAGKVRAARRGAFFRDFGRCSPDTRVLEIGCGTGLFTEEVSKSGAHVLAVDISPELLDRAHQRDLPEDRVEFVEARFESYVPGGEQFDVVFGSSVIHHLNIAEAVGHIYALLKPGGRMVFTEPNMLNPQIFLERNVGFIRRMMHASPDETAIVRWKLAQQLKEAGFTDVRVINFDWLHPWTPRFLIPSVRKLTSVLEAIPLIKEFSGSVLITAAKPPRP